MNRLSDKQYLELTKLSYLSKKAFDYVFDIATSPTLAEFASILLKDSKIDGEDGNPLVSFVDPKKRAKENGGIYEQGFRNTLTYLKNNPFLSKLILVDYQNNNSTSGFVATVYKGGENNRPPTGIAA